MPIVSSKDVAFLLVDGYNLLGVSTEIKDPGAERETKDLLFLGEELRHKALTGVSFCDIEQNGAFDDAVGSSHDVLSMMGSGRILSWGATGNLLGGHYVGAVVDQIAYAPALISGDFHEARARYSCSKHEEGFIVALLAARTTAGNTQTTPLDNAAHSHGGGVAYLQCSALTLGGYTNLDVRVRHSATLASWADLATFTARTTVGAQRLVISTDPIERYLAVSWAWTGAGAGQSATFTVGVARNE